MLKIERKLKQKIAHDKITVRPLPTLMHAIGMQNAD
jgi:hypothetical protein